MTAPGEASWTLRVLPADGVTLRVAVTLSDAWFVRV
jgi:hypothetical protein